MFCPQICWKVHVYHSEPCLTSLGFVFTVRDVRFCPMGAQLHCTRLTNLKTNEIKIMLNLVQIKKYYFLTF